MSSLNRQFPLGSTTKFHFRNVLRFPNWNFGSIYYSIVTSNMKWQDFTSVSGRQMLPEWEKIENGDINYSFLIWQGIYEGFLINTISLIYRYKHVNQLFLHFYYVIIKNGNFQFNIQFIINTRIFYEGICLLFYILTWCRYFIVCFWIQKYQNYKENQN